MNRKIKAFFTRSVVWVALLSVLFTALIIPALATTESSDERVAVDAEITPAKGGATSIATMTFDDGLVQTANKLNELCAQYGLRASLVLVSKNYVTYDQSAKTYTVLNGTSTASYYVGNPTGKTTKADEMNAILAEGYLDITSHSRNHIILNTATMDHLIAQWDGVTKQDLITNEMAGSIDDLKLAFPDYEVLTYGVPSSSLASGTYDTLYDTFYAARSGNCVLIHSSYQGKIQSIDPPVGNAAGSWYNPLGIRLMQEKETYQDSIDIDKILAYLDTCVENNGWFISTAHGIVETENYDISVEELSQLMAKMQKYQNAGKLWVATYNEATKYIRERQNSVASAYSVNGNYYVSVAMNSTTEDGLTLSSDVFNYPLTVKIEVPREWTRVSYTLNGETVNTKCVAVGATNYAYVDVVPNGGEVEVTDGTLPEEKDDFYPGKYALPTETAWDHSTEENLAAYPNILFGIWESEADFEAGEPPVIWRSSDTNATNYSAGLDANFIGAADSNGTKYYKFAVSSETDKYTNALEETSTGDGTVAFTRYVHVYQDTALIAGTASTTQLVTAQKQTLIVDLGGNSLDLIGVRVGGQSTTLPYASFTLKNGFADHKSAQNQPRPDTTFKFENIDLTMTYTSTFVYDGGANLIEYKNCIIRAKDTNTFDIGGGYDSIPGVVNFINTDIVYATAPSTFFMTIKESYDRGATQLTVNFDKNSSVSGGFTGDNWFVFTEGFSYSASNYVAATEDTKAYMKGNYVESNGQFPSKQVINFELGVEFKGGATPPTSYTFWDVDYDESLKNSHSSSKTAITYIKSTLPINDELCNINYVDPTTGEAVTDYWMLYDETDDSYEMVTDFIGYTMVKLDEENKIVGKAWTGTSVSATDIQEAESIVVLNSATGEAYDGEYCFLYNEETAEYDLVTDYSAYDMIAYEDETLLVGVYSWADGEYLVGNASNSEPYLLDYLPSGVYIKLYNDAEFGNFKTPVQFSITFDLNGYTFTNTNHTSTIVLGNPGGSAVWFEREISFINTSDSPATLDLTKRSSTLFQPRPGTVMLFEDLTVKVAGTMFNDGGAKSITFRNCDVKSSGSMITNSGVNPVCCTAYLDNSENNYREYIFDNTSLDNITVGSFITEATDRYDRAKITFKNGCVIDNAYNPVLASVTGATVEKLVLDIATDTKFTAEVTSATSFITKTEGLAAIVEENYYSDIAAGTKVAKEDLISARKGTYYAVVGKDEEVVYGYKITTAAGDETVYLADYNEAGEAILTCSEIMSIPEGGTITFLTNLEYDPTGSTAGIGRVHNFADDITVDLNNYTFTLNYRWQVGYGDCDNFIFKNGSIVSPEATENMFFGNAGAGSVFTFENVHFTTSAYNIFQLYTGTLIIRGGSLNAPGLTAINFPSQAFHSLTLDGVEVNAGILLSKVYISGTQNTYTVNNCDINVTNAVFRIGAGTFAGATDDYVNINVTDSKIMGELFSGYSGITAPLFHITLSETYLSKLPTVIETQATLSYGENQLLMGIVDSANEGYNYLVSASRPAVGTNLQANLTLSTNFDVNFYALSDIVLGIYRDGELLESVKSGGKDIYTLNFPAHVAADAVTLEVWVKSGDITYKLPLEYSVLTYANKLVATDGVSAEAVTLAKAAVAYIKEAYYIANANVESYTLPADLAAFESAVTPADAGTAELTTLTEAVASVRFELESSVNLVLTIANDYNGTIAVNGTVYTVTAGEVVEIPMKAKLLADDITVTSENNTATFTLAGYVNSTSVQGSDMEALVEALYTYAYYAKAYATSDAGQNLQ
ncbi:MAG: polysaccharide deacetylase family protein [Clostridia bacterium]|nr:polysaccharide deacetylase family protein [Clostridia bacterium]